MNQILLSAESIGETFAERTAYALSHTGVGMLIIFGVLAVIWAILAVFKVIFGTKTEKKEKAPAPAAAPAPVANAVEVPVVAPTSSDEEIVAAITAAITLYREAEGVTGAFRVVSFKRTGGARPWNQA